MKLLCVLPLVLLCACPSTHRRLPRDPEPLRSLNTQWDDYNSAPPPRLEQFIWSTNRGTEGKQFDLWTASGAFRRDGFRVDHAPASLAGVVSSGNEFGPTYAAYDKFASSAGKSSWDPQDTPLVFASDRAGGKGKLDLYVKVGEAVTSLPHLNSASNDSYWCVFAPRPYKVRNDGVPVGNPSAAYFASDRGGNGYDIYEIRWPEGKRAAFGGEGCVIRKVEALCTDADDTAPYALENRWGSWLFFASNRKGGRGGFDLYVAKWDDQTSRWGAPENLGRRYNTKHNEFRPALTREMMLFSSDRPGGKGGYDLYYARLPELD